MTTSNVSFEIRPVWSAFRWEWFRYCRRVSVWLLAGMFAGAIVIVTGGVVLFDNLGQRFGETLSPAAFPNVVLELPVQAGPILAIALISIAFGGEFQWGTIRSLTARGAPRWHTVVAKLALVSIYITVLWAFAYALSALVGLAVGGSNPESPLELTETLTWGDTIVKLFAVWLTALAYAGLGALLTVLGRSTAFGLGIAVGIFLFESIVYPIAGGVATLAGSSVSEYTAWTLRGATLELIRGNGDLNRWVVLPVVLAYIGLLWSLTLVVLRRRDLGSGNG
jgi:ABC-type transport system involved in multi-copper enzyme maturation permease subunit